nr:hypothetical protein [Deltaproteobacteria bacterium]
GGWILIAYNDQTQTFVEFARSWQEYADGFGNLSIGERGWLGNERIHQLSDAGAELQVRHDHGTNPYPEFGVGDEPSGYPLTVSDTPLSLDGGFFEASHDGMSFSTFDSDNDTHVENCAANHNAGWWYSDCFAVSIASGQDGGQVYWRPPPPNSAAPLYVAWIGLWIR